MNANEHEFISDSRFSRVFAAVLLPHKFKIAKDAMSAKEFKTFGNGSA
jgi:hypothetical protein